MWFMHDGAPSHFARAVRRHLTRRYGERWMGRGGPVPWPPRSPDLNPVDYCVWGHVKSLVYSYASAVDTNEELQHRIEGAC
jgi:transposase